jgi:hypothetical protein
MKRVLLLLAFVSMTAIGCQTHSQLANDDCQNCGPSGHGQYATTCQGSGCGLHARPCGPAGCYGSYGRNSPDFVPQIPCNYHRQVEPAGPPTGTYAYPYYTVRAPRDFFLDAPSTIGY